MNLHSHRRQQGLSLVELMVGMVISLITALAMLSVYKTVAKVTAESKLGGNIDGQIAVGLLTADKTLQSAGYKGGDTAATTSVYSSDLLLIQNATLAGSTLTGTAYGTPPTTTAVIGNALIWQVNSSGTYELQGIYAPTTGGLIMIKSSTAVTTSPSAISSSWSGAAWTSQPLVTAPSTTIPSAMNAGLSTISISYTGATTKCQPFGSTSNTTGGSYVVTINTTGYSGNQQAIQSTTCLINYN